MSGCSDGMRPSVRNEIMAEMAANGTNEEDMMIDEESLKEVEEGVNEVVG